jgi:hypothetical protein
LANGFSDTLRVLYYEKNKKCWEAKKKKLFAVFFFSFCYNSCWGNRILLKFCTSNLGVVFHIWCKRLDLFWTVRGLISKIPTYRTCQLAPLSPYSGYYVLNLARNHTAMHLFSSLITLYRYSYIPMTGPNMVVDDLPNQRGGLTFLRQRVLYFNTQI